LYGYDDCGGDYQILENGIKDCSNCALPHKEGGYDTIVAQLIKKNRTGD
jgi:Zn-finger protein